MRGESNGLLYPAGESPVSSSLLGLIGSGASRPILLKRASWFSNGRESDPSLSTRSARQYDAQGALIRSTVAVEQPGMLARYQRGKDPHRVELSNGRHTPVQVDSPEPYPGLSGIPEAPISCAAMHHEPADYGAGVARRRGSARLVLGAPDSFHRGRWPARRSPREAPHERQTFPTA